MSLLKKLQHGALVLSLAAFSCKTSSDKGIDYVAQSDNTTIGNYVVDSSDYNKIIEISQRVSCLEEPLNPYAVRSVLEALDKDGNHVIGKNELDVFQSVDELPDCYLKNN